MVPSATYTAALIRPTSAGTECCTGGSMNHVSALSPFPRPRYFVIASKQTYVEIMLVRAAPMESAVSTSHPTGS